MAAAAVPVAVVVYPGVDGLKAALVHKLRVVQDDFRITVGKYFAFFYDNRAGTDLLGKGKVMGSDQLALSQPL
jgi:hypothetical protein